MPRPRPAARGQHLSLLCSEPQGGVARPCAVEEAVWELASGLTKPLMAREACRAAEIGTAKNSA